MPEGTPKVEMLALEILESLAEAVVVGAVVGAGAVEVDGAVDMVEMISAAKEHQRQCHKMCKIGGGFYSCLCICIGQNT
jgi:hypothetical protein